METDGLFATAAGHHRAGRLAEAETAYRALLREYPDHADGLHLLGLILAQTGRRPEAESLLQQAAEVLPGRPDVHNNLGELLRQLGRPAEAEPHLRRALVLAPQFPEAHFNLGNTLKEQGRHPEAVARYEAAVRLRPNYAAALYNLGNALREEGRCVRAVNAYRQALTHRPDWRDVHLNLANALYELRSLDDAAIHYRRAAELAPGDPNLDDSLGHVFAAQGRTTEAAECYRRALALRPGDWLRELRLVGLAPPIPASNGAIDEYRQSLATALDRIFEHRPTADVAFLHRSGAEPPLLLAYQGRDDLPLKRRYAEMFAAALPVEDPPPPGEGLPHVGVVVTHGHEGVFARCLGELVARLDRRQLRVEVVCPRASANVLRHTLPHASLDFFILPERLDEATAALRAARFDLLHYWEVGTDSTNYFLPYLRPARAQSATWGWPVTTGVPAVDYFVSAADLEPEGADVHYTERLVQLPSLPTYYLRPPVPDRSPERGRYGLRADEHVYLCQQNLRKYHPDFDSILADILRADPAGCIVLIADEQPFITEQLLNRLRAALPDASTRLHVAPRTGREEYLGLVATADVVLDTVHYGGGANTAYDAAACGTPTVTLPGPYHRGRWAAAVNSRLGAPELNASSSTEYVRTAVQVATDRAWRADLNCRILAANDGLFQDTRAVEELTAFILKAVHNSRLISSAAQSAIVTPRIPL